MVLTIKSYGIDAVGNTETLFACTALLSVAALAGVQEFVTQIGPEAAIQSAWRVVIK